MTFGSKVLVDRRYARIVSLEYSQYPVSENASFDTLAVVGEMNWSRYQLLRQLQKNSSLTEEEEMEMKGYEVNVPIEEMEPADEIKFVTPRYELKFVVRNGGFIRIDGDLYRVVYIDPAHFYVVGKSMNYWHVFQFADRMAMSYTTVEKVSDDASYSA